MEMRRSVMTRNNVSLSFILYSSSFFFFFFFFFFIVIPYSASSVEAGGSSIGINYGRVADNLPPAGNVVQLLKSSGITRVKLFDADPTILRALNGTGISAIVTLPNEQLSSVAQNPGAAFFWIKTNLLPHLPGTAVSGIAVGNEVFVDPSNITSYLVPAMENIHSALVKLNLDSAIKISSPIALSALGSSYPSSAGAFKQELATTVVKPILEFLRRTGSKLMLNVYPFFAYTANSGVISLDYALFRPNPGVVDSGSNLRYVSLFDAQLDAVFSAMAALGYSDLNVMVSETGWPSKGDANEVGADVANAAAYNGNLVRRVLSGNGTPLRPQAELEVYLFALFNEDQKPGPTSERNYGLFYPNEEKVYEVPLLSKMVDDSRPAAAAGNPSNAKVKEVVKKIISTNYHPAPPPPPPAAAEMISRSRNWCVAKNGVGRVRLQAGLDYACGPGGADCGPIQEGAQCFEPNTLEAHASYAFNSYYQKKKRIVDDVGTCNFLGAASLVHQPPNFGKCALPAE